MINDTILLMLFHKVGLNNITTEHDLRVLTNTGDD